MTSKSISQNLNDSITCIPNSQLRLAINLIEKGKVTQEELDSTKQLVNYLNKRITTKDSLLYRYGQKDQVWKKIDENNKQKINNLNTVISNSNKIIDIQSKSIKRSKFGKITMLMLGLATGIIITK
jgi:UDP-N-acetyl-D-mannosaminuronic acid transferase (WecB/TagA/CpsF family)